MGIIIRTVSVSLLAALAALSPMAHAQEAAAPEQRAGKLRLQGRASIDRRTHVAGAVVTARPEGDASRIYITSTDADGDFRIEGLPEGDYTVRIERSGFATVVKERVQLKFPFRAVVEVTMARADDLAPVASADPTEDEPEPLDVRGLVVHRDGNEPVAEARVRFVHPEGVANPRALQTGADGRFEVDELPAGSWELLVDAVGYIGVSVVLDLRETSRIGLALVKQPATYAPTPYELMPPERLEPPEGLAAISVVR